MPIRFTCRLVANRTASGKLKVQYDWLGNPHERLFVLHGPRIVQPPEGEMNEEEMLQWERCIMGEFEFDAERTSVDAPLVEAKQTIEDRIPKGSVHTELRWAVHEESGIRTLGVAVANGWNERIPKFTLSIDHRNESPQPANTTSGVEAIELEGSLSCFIPGIVAGPDLWPARDGLTIGYYADPGAMPSLRSRAASMSPESFWIALRTDGYEFDRIPGAEIAAMLTNDDAE